MLYLIYLCIIDKANEEGKYQKLDRRSKIPIEISLVEMVQRLNTTHSFQSFHNGHPERQSKMPLKEWVKEAVEKLVSIQEAIWNDALKENFTFYIKEHSGDVKSHYETKCLEETISKTQMDLFENLE